MPGNKRFVRAWAAGAVFLLMFFYAATAWLWSAARASGAAALESQVSAVLANDLAEGNLFKLGASLSRLMQAGSLDYAEIRSYSAGGGWEPVFRTRSYYGDTGPAFNGYSCSFGRKLIPHRGEGVSLVTTLPSNIEGSQCVALLLSSDLPADLKTFKNRLSIAFGLLLAGVLALFLKLTISWHKKNLELEVAARTAAAEKEAAVGRMAAQVAHDIRSPLVALDTALRHASALPEEQRVMARHAVNRIRDIASNLLERHKLPGAAPASGAEPVSAGGQEANLLSSLIEPVVAEKRLQFESMPGVAIDFDLAPAAYGLFAVLQPVEFRRLLSNLLNNAVEAVGAKGSVKVSLARGDGAVLVSVADTGKGIPAELLARLGRKGETHGKPGGSGLGLYHAKTTAERWGGKLDILSEPGRGTTVTVSLPAAAAPAWFVSRLELPAGAAVAVLDDDETIHQVWKGRFESSRVMEKGVELLRFSAPDKFRDWVKANPAKAARAVYLLDYELLGSEETGLSLAQEFGIARQTILVTSRYEEKRIFEECLRLNMRVLPKGLAGLVPVSVRVPRALLLDDDQLVHMNWKLAAKAAGVELKAYARPEEFLAELAGLPKDIPVYIDSELGEGVKGETIAEGLRKDGFTDLTLATGHGRERFVGLPWLKVSGKEPPWA